MGHIPVVMDRLYVAFALSRRRIRRRNERGDVPGWVMITVMTAGLVMGIWGLAEGQLQSMLSNALNQVK
ncbi:MAG: hypothetical protein JWO11_2725 [Nocardioides sp.]|jgi:hypothetical protein|nr:hypothetical protein [Nocardioides sp.]